MKEIIKTYALFIGYETPYDLDLKHNEVLPKLDKSFKRIELEGDIVHVVPVDRMIQAQLIIEEINEKENTNLCCSFEEYNMEALS